MLTSSFALHARRCPWRITRQCLTYRRTCRACQPIRVLVVLAAACHGSRMSTLAEIEAALPMLSAEGLARVEVTVHRLQREREAPGHAERADARLMADHGR